MARKNGGRAKCQDHGCPSRTACLRYMAPAAAIQTYAEFVRPDDAERCEDYLPLEEE